MSSFPLFVHLALFAIEITWHEANWSCFVPLSPFSIVNAPFPRSVILPMVGASTMRLASVVGNEKLDSDVEIGAPVYLDP